ncbi:MAG: ABC transporter permease [Pseudomonadota bacterium]|jgi:ABC-2 type transport system permease protein|nr:ABC transporter permease [Pseudomonadota bacterium]
MIRSTYLVARRDYLGYVSAWGFWLGLLFTPVILAVFILAPTFAQNAQPTRYYTVIEQGSAFTEAMRAEMSGSDARAARVMLDPMAAAEQRTSEQVDAFDQALADGASVADAFAAAGGNPALLPKRDFVEVAPPVMTGEALAPYLLGETLIDTEDGPQPLFAALLVNEETQEIEYWSENLQARTLISAARQAEQDLQLDRALAAVNVNRDVLTQAREARRSVKQQRVRTGADADTGSEVTQADQAPFVVSIMMAFSLWFLIFSVINYLLMGTIEERSNKIFDSLLTSVKLPHLLAGKLIAVLLLALTLMAFWGFGSALLTWFMRDSIDAEVSSFLATMITAAANPALFVPAILSFVLGYLMYGSMFLALGSLCDTIQEAQTLMTPLFVTLMAPLAMLAFAVQDAESALIEIMAWVPFFTPFLLILRMPTEPPVWEVLSQLGLMALTTFIILQLATRVYRAGAVHGAGVNDVLAFFGKLVPGKKSAA